jgi:hypothetical protein
MVPRWYPIVPNGCLAFVCRRRDRELFQPQSFLVTTLRAVWFFAVGLRGVCLPSERLPSQRQLWPKSFPVEAVIGGTMVS